MSGSAPAAFIGKLAYDDKVLSTIPHSALYSIKIIINPFYLKKLIYLIYRSMTYLKITTQRSMICMSIPMKIKRWFHKKKLHVLSHRHLFHTWATLTNKTRYLTRDRTPLASMAYISIILYFPLYS